MRAGVDVSLSDNLSQSELMPPGAADLLRALPMYRSLEPVGSQKWELPADKQFERFVAAYSERLVAFLNRSTEGNYSEDVRAAFLSTDPLNDDVGEPPALLSHLRSNVAPMLRAAKASIRNLSQEEIATLSQIIDVMLTLGSGTAENSSERRHWLYAAGRQLVDTLQSKGFLAQHEETRQRTPSLSCVLTASNGYALAA